MLAVSMTYATCQGRAIV